MKNLKNFFAIAAAVMAMSSCSKSDLNLEAIAPQPEDRTPEYFIPVDGETVDVIFDDESVIRTDHVFSVIAEDTIRVAGESGVKAAEALRKVAEETLYFAYNHNINNEVVVEGLTMSFVYEGVDYTLSCGVELTVSGSHEVIETSSEQGFYELSKTDYVLSFGELELAGDTQVFVVEENMPQPAEEPVGFRVKDVDLVNVVLSDESLIENVEHPFGLTAQDPIRVTGTTGIKAAEALSKVAEETLTFAYNYNISNEVVVEGLTMQFTYKGREYTIPCLDELTVSGSHRIVETSSEQGFYELSETDYVLSYGELELADAAQAFVVEEGYVPPTVDHVAWSHRHIAFRPQAVVANNTISVVCDNVATLTTFMSDGTTTEVSINYTVTNWFVYSLPELPASVIGKRFYFNAGTADIEGYNMTIFFLRREVSSIIVNGTDYRNEAPQCEVAETCVAFNEESAVATFEHGDEKISATIPVDYIKAEIINGEIMGMWVTDAYQGRTLTSTDLHILARNNNGSYTVYSRGVNETSFTTSPLTASEGQYILNSGFPVAWVYTADGSRVLSVVDYIQSSKENTGYVIDYLNFNGQVLIALGDAEATFNGEPFAEPLKATGIAENGTWTISYNGVVNYFVGTINM